MVAYSYVIQGLSRLLFVVLYQHRNLLSYKCHIILIICQIFICFLIPLSGLITKDVVFRPFHICFFASHNTILIIYSYASAYFIPLFIIIIIYGVIYCRVIQSSTTVRHSSHPTKRDLDLIKNILILFMVFLLAGIPSVIYGIIPRQNRPVSASFNMFPIIAMIIAAAIEKICLIILNKEIRREMIKLLTKLCPARTSNLTDVQSFS